MSGGVAYKNHEMAALKPDARISRTWVAIGCLLLALFFSAILTPNAEVLAACVGALSACLAAMGFYRRPNSVPGLAADAIVFVFGVAFVASLVVPRHWKGH